MGLLLGSSRDISCCCCLLRWRCGRVHIVFCKQVVRIGHGFELKIIATGIFEEHRPLLAGLAFEAQVWRNDELRVCFLEFRSQSLECISIQNCPKVGHWYFITIYWIVIVNSTVIISDPVAHKLQ